MVQSKQHMICRLLASRGGGGGGGGGGGREVQAVMEETVDPQERTTWRSGVRSAMRAASPLPGKGPTDVDDAPAPAR